MILKGSCGKWFPKWVLQNWTATVVKPWGWIGSPGVIQSIPLPLSRPHNHSGPEKGRSLQRGFYLIWRGFSFCLSIRDYLLGIDYLLGMVISNVNPCFFFQFKILPLSLISVTVGNSWPLPPPTIMDFHNIYGTKVKVEHNWPGPSWCLGNCIDRNLIWSFLCGIEALHRSLLLYLYLQSVSTYQTGSHARDLQAHYGFC